MKVNEKKVEQVGKKLDVDPSILKEQKFKDAVQMTNIFTIILSSFLGFFLGTRESMKITGYPFANTNDMIGIWSVSSLNFLNGRFTLSDRLNAISSKKTRVRVFIRTTLLAILTYFLFFGIFSASADSSGIMYNVYHSEKQN